MTVETLLDQWWGYCADHVLMYRKCDTCELASMIVRRYCPRCSAELTWYPAPPIGSVFTFTSVNRSTVMGVGRAAPYTLAYVEIFPGGPLWLTNVRHEGPLSIGQSVQLDFTPHAGHSVPVYRTIENGGIDGEN